MTELLDRAKTDLHDYLRSGREALLWKLDGLSEYDVRRPLMPTGTNLLGMVKHVAGVDVGYFGECFGRPFTEPLPWFDDDAEPNADIVRELIDGSAGLRPEAPNLPDADPTWWEDYRSPVEQAARDATG